MGKLEKKLVLISVMHIISHQFVRTRASQNSIYTNKLDRVRTIYEHHQLDQMTLTHNPRTRVMNKFIGSGRVKWNWHSEMTVNKMSQISMKNNNNKIEH